MTLINECEIITFGKFRGQNIYTIIEDDPNYCLWVLKQKQILETYPEIKKILEDVFLNKDDIYLHFGKYKNKSLSFVKENDPKYLIYLKNNEYVVKNCSNIIEYINDIKLL